MQLFGKKKYIVIFAKKMNGVYQKIGKKRIKPTDKVVTYENKTIPISFDSALYEDENKVMLLIDIDDLQIKSGETLVNKVPYTLVKAIVKDKVVNQLISRLAPSGMGMISVVLMLMTILAGVFIGYFLGSVMPYEALAQSLRNFKWG